MPQVLSVTAGPRGGKVHGHCPYHIHWMPSRYFGGCSALFDVKKTKASLEEFKLLQPLPKQFLAAASQTLEGME